MSAGLRWLALCLVVAQAQDEAGAGETCTNCDAGRVTKRQHHWPLQKGTPERTGYSPYVMPNISSPSWVWKAPEFMDIYRATPLIDDALNVYVTSIAGRTFKLSPDGQQLWSHYTGPERGGVAGVPVMEDDRLFILTAKAVLIALNIDTGVESWSRQVAKLTDSTTDCMLSTNGQLILAVTDPVPAEIVLGVKARFDFDNNAILGVSSSDGSVLWRFTPYMTVYNFQASTQHDGSFVFQDLTGSVYRVSLEGKLVWYGGAMDRKSATTAAAVISEGKVYAVSNMGGGMKPNMGEGRGLLHVYDYETGMPLWRQELPYEGNQAVAVGDIAGGHGRSLILGMGKNPGPAWFVLMSYILPAWLIPFTTPIYLLTLRFPTWFASKQGRAIAAFTADTGDLRWWYEMPPYLKFSSEGDNEKFVQRYKEWAENPNNEPVCMPDANAQPVIDGAGTAFVPFQDGNVYAVRDANGDGVISGDEVQVHKVGDAFQASAAMAPKMLAFLDCQGRLEVFRG